MTKLANLVRQMRLAQKAYFRSRDSWLMAEAKRLEREVDRAVEEALEQPTLFGDDR